jgi:pimeloyl-ACP methyl ester carboxylesterase
MLGLKQPTLVGHSLGGAVSLAIALDHPDCVGGIALIAPVTQAQEPLLPKELQGLAINSPLMRTLVAWTLAIPLSIRNAPGQLKIVFGPDAVPADFPTRGGLLGLRPNNFYNASSDLVAVNEDLPKMMKRYGGLSIPLGMVYAKDDQILDYRKQGEAMKQQFPALDLALLEKHGHMLPVTAPDATLNMIQRVAARKSIPRATMA